MEGWIKLHRRILENPIVCKDSDYLSVWIYLLLKATHNGRYELFKGEKILLNPGQLITGRKVIASKFGISESKVFRILKSFKSEQQIEQQTSSKNSLITILNWGLYQESEHQNEQQLNSKRTTTEQQMNNKRTASEQQLNTINNDKNEKNERNSNGDLEEFFESIWTLYPVKMGKGSVSKTQKKNLQDIGYEQIKRCIERYVSEMESLNRERKYWKNGSTFFNSGDVDYLDCNAEEKKKVVDVPEEQIIDLWSDV